MRRKKIRIGVLGCARIARRSMIPAILQLKDRFELVAVASRDATKAAQFAGEFGCEALTGYEALIDRGDVDALYIPLPTGLHAQWVGRALAAGKHVYVEKSFASSLPESEALVAAARLANVAAMEGYMFLYHRQQAVVADWLQQGAIGELRHFHGSFGFPPLPEGDFRYDEVVGGGALMDAAGYPLRAAHHFVGNNLEVRAASGRNREENGTKGTTLWGSAFLAGHAGIGASIAYGFENFYQCRYELWGSRGKISAERAYTPAPTFTPLLVLETAEGRQERLVEPDNHFLGALKEFESLVNEPARREAHYQQILLQSRSLQAIRRLLT